MRSIVPAVSALLFVSFLFSPAVAQYSGTAITEVSVGSKVLTAQDVSVEITDAEVAGLDVLPGGVVYQYVNVTLRALQPASGASISFDVDKSWMAENSVGSSSIVMLRFDSGEWEELDTRILSDNVDTVSYQADTPGFSVFVISGESAAPIAQQETTGSQSEIVEVSSAEDVVESKYRENILWGAVAAAVVAAIAALFLIPGSLVRRKKLRR